MSGAGYLRLRKMLTGSVPQPIWPTGIILKRLDAADPGAVHALLESTFPGQIAPLATWHSALITDSEYDPALCLVAVSEGGAIAGYIQCWTSNFIKDLAVAPAFRGRGLGAALMQHMFATFAQRGAPHVDLKVEAENATARRLYERLGMVDVTDAA